MGLAQLQQSPGFDLPNPLSGEGHRFTDLRQGAGGVVLEPKAPTDHFRLPVSELIQQVFQVVTQGVPGQFLLGSGFAILQQVAELGVLFAAHAHFKGDRAGNSHQGQAHRFLAEPETLGQV